MDKIVFFHMNQLGDLMFSLPLLSKAREQWGGCRLYSVARPELAPLLTATGFVDRVFERPKNGFMGKAKLVCDLKKEGFDKAVFFSESPEALLTGCLSCIPERIGFETSSLGFLLTGKARRTGVPSLKNNVLLGAAAGLAGVSEDYSGLMRTSGDLVSRAMDWRKSEGSDRSDLVVISPGSSRRRTEKCWLPDRWSAVIDKIAGAGAVPVLAGSPSERPMLEDIAARCRGKVSIFPSSGGLAALSGLMRTARLFVGIDSGAAHLAAAVGVKAAVLFGPTDPEQVGPRPAGKHIIIRSERMAMISVADVWNGISGSL